METPGFVNFILKCYVRVWLLSQTRLSLMSLLGSFSRCLTNLATFWLILQRPATLANSKVTFKNTKSKTHTKPFKDTQVTSEVHLKFLPVAGESLLAGLWNPSGPLSPLPSLVCELQYHSFKSLPSHLPWLLLQSPSFCLLPFHIMPTQTTHPSRSPLVILFQGSHVAHTKNRIQIVS